MSGLALAEIGTTLKAQPPPPPSLMQIGARCGLRVGACASKVKLQRQQGFSDFFIANFNILTPEAEMKWGALHPAPDQYNFADADWLVDFALKNNILVHGHNLCWNTGNPSWLKQVITKDNAERILTDHITTVMNHFRGKLDSWDVVNEPIGIWFNRPDGLYTGPWTDTLGPRYIDIAFHAAAQVDPKPLRILNIHNVEHGDADNGRARQAAIRLATRLVKSGVPVQAVGIESHLDGWRAVDNRALADFIHTFRDLGLQVLTTELDVNDSKVQGDIPARDRIVAQYYGNYVSAFYRAAGVPNRLILWTPLDKSNWMDYMKNAPRWQREDGQENKHRPGLLDENMNVKPAFLALASGIQQVCTST